MRQFIERTGGNLAAYMQGRSDWGMYQSRWGAGIVSHLPTNVAEAEHLVDGTAYSSWEWEGDEHKLPTSDPRYAAYAISGFGCYDAHSYHVAGDPYPQAFTDEKMLNCVHHFMADALCRWDGGELWDNSMATYTWNMSSTARTYPWGNTPVPISFTTIGNSSQYFNHPWTPGDVFEYAVHKWSYPYVDGEQASLPAYAAGGNSYSLPPPGRRPKGYSRPVGVAYDPANPLVGVADVAGGIFQLAREPTQNYGFANSGSYEVHNIGTYGDAGGWQMGRRYAGAGARCSR